MKSSQRPTEFEQNNNDVSTKKKENNISKESKNSTARLTLKQDGDSTKSRGETCRQLRHRRQTGIKTHWKTSNWNSQHPSRSDDL